MAKRNVPDAVRGAPSPLVIATHTWGVDATGTAAQIVEAGLCVPSQFPQGRKRSEWHSLPDGGSLSFLRQKGGAWKLRYRWSNEKRTQLELRQKLREIKQARLDEMCRDSETWKAKELKRICGLMDLPLSFMSSDCGWHFSVKARREVEVLVGRIRIALLNADVQLDEQVRAAYLAANAIDDEPTSLPNSRPTHLRLAYTQCTASGHQS